MADLSAIAVHLANQEFWAKHPELRGRPLTMDATDEAYRREWIRDYRAAVKSGSKPPRPRVSPVPVTPLPGISVTSVQSCPIEEVHLPEVQIRQLLQRAKEMLLGTAELSSPTWLLQEIIRLWNQAENPQHTARPGSQVTSSQNYVPVLLNGTANDFPMVYENVPNSASSAGRNYFQSLNAYQNPPKYKSMGYDTKTGEFKEMPVYGETINTMDLTIAAKAVRLVAYTNLDSKGRKDGEDGPFQCTALIAQYLQQLGFPIPNPKIVGFAYPNGGYVAGNLGQENSYYRKYFSYSGGGLAWKEVPMVGSIISFFGYSGKDSSSLQDQFGHVAIVKSEREIPSPSPRQTIEVDLIEDNFSKANASDDEYAVNRIITFTRADANSSWHEVLDKNNDLGYRVYDWVTPTSVGPDFRKTYSVTPPRSSGDSHLESS